MSLDHFEKGGVKSGPYGSLLRQKYGIRDDIRPEVYSPRGLVAQRNIMQQYLDAGSTFGEAHTFGLGLRVNPSLGDEEWEYSGPQLPLPDDQNSYVRSAVQLAQKFNGPLGRPWIATIAPLTDTSGGQDPEWKALDGKQFAWARRRHEPFVRALKESGAQVLWGEAFRYQEEARAVASLANQFKLRMVVICFEAKDQGHPDPRYDGSYGFKESKRDLQAEAPGITVWTGANCAGVSVIERTWQRGDRMDAMYPNRNDFGNGREKLRPRYLELLRREKCSDAEERELREIECELNTPEATLHHTWKEARDHGVKVIGICCGGNPLLVQQASEVFHCH